MENCLTVPWLILLSCTCTMLIHCFFWLTYHQCTQALDLRCSVSVAKNRTEPPGFEHQFCCSLGFSGGSDGTKSAHNAEDLVWSLGQEDPLRREWLPTPVLLPEEFHGQRHLVCYSPWSRKESDRTEQLTHTHTHTHTHTLLLASWVTLDKSFNVCNPVSSSVEASVLMVETCYMEVIK